MKRAMVTVATLLLLTGSVAGQNKTVTQLPETTTSAPSDLLYIVRNPATTPTDYKITLANLGAAMTNVVHITGTESITGAKTFTAPVTMTTSLTATNIDATALRLQFREQAGDGALITLNPVMSVNLTNPATNDKRGLEMRVITTNGSDTINTGGIWVNIYTPPDNGGDVSGIGAIQTGGGNAASFFNISSLRPSGFTQYTDAGWGVEVGVDGGKGGVLSQPETGAAFFALFGRTGAANDAGGIGLLVRPSQNINLSRRAISVQNAAGSAETVFIDLAGNAHFGSFVNAQGGFQVGGVSLNFSHLAGSVADAQLRQSIGLSVIGRAANTTGNVADITAAADFNVLRRSGATIGFGSIDLSQSGAVGTSILGAVNGGTGISSLGAGITTWLGTPSSANLRAALTDESGTGAALFDNATSPTFNASITTPVVIGGSGSGSSLELRSTSGVGATDFIKLSVGSNGSTEALRLNTAGHSSFFNSTLDSWETGWGAVYYGRDNTISTDSKTGSASAGFVVSQNAYYNGSAWQRIESSTSAASGFYLSGGLTVFRNAGNGTGAITWTNSGIFDASGRFGTGAFAAATGNHVCYDTTTNAGFNTLATCSSLSIFKADIRPLESGLSDVMRLRPVAYTSKTSGRREVGFVAEEVESIDSRIATYYQGRLIGVEYDKITAILTRAIQEQQAHILELERKITLLLKARQNGL